MTIKHWGKLDNEYNKKPAGGEIDGNQSQTVEQITYLGVLINRDGKMD